MGRPFFKSLSVPYSFCLFWLFLVENNFMSIIRPLTQCQWLTHQDILLVAHRLFVLMRGVCFILGQRLPCEASYFIIIIIIFSFSYPQALVKNFMSTCLQYTMITSSLCGVGACMKHSSILPLPTRPALSASIRAVYLEVLIKSVIIHTD